ncbi:putative disease resistance RPP13-like protein 3 [Brachypodium distachyon]|uniref:AAA+ ATPase domain-containing protein n=3 Tax=Brachypodium distachyon TaxID=15368 RepID=I1IKT0_BRADI|nr:putative disease resistance RPP13-like protein 3 [Brachypodium distachyon]KQJ88062.1 hypothetical protein BRADI_4g15067v3 [Brachypodium distachyon]|eukprot:XP_003577417.1 putative disease resistance RPP13-like protein 3 [Brachypodium distachyon]
MDLVVGASSDAAKSLVNKLGSLLAKEYALIEGVRDDIQYINDELESMQALISTLKRARTRSEQRQGWMKQVREVSFDIEDCIDDVNHRLREEPRGGRLVYLRRKWYLLTTLYARRCIAAEIRDLKLRAQHVSERRARYGVENLTAADLKEISEDAEAPRDLVPPPPQLIHTRQIVGMEDAIEELQVWIRKEEPNAAQSTCKTRFLAIFGSGGIGKTTLAMELYRKVGGEFHRRASVQVSQKFDLLMLLRSLVRQLQQFGADPRDEEPLDRIEKMEEGPLKEKLQSQLKDKRYLILIDDIWSVSAWEKIKDCLPERECGRLIVTTRFKSIAVACQRRQKGDCLHEHRKLDKKKSYHLFRQIISSAPEDPTVAAKNLLDKCGGIPLAVIVVAGLIASKLRSETSKKTLHDYLQDVDKALSEGLGTPPSTDEVKKILDQCYNSLPADLKTCLLYLSMFPKGCIISRKRLIRRWIAEGFMIEKHGKPVQEVAEDSFNELISRNLIRAVNNTSNGKVKSYQIHDMVHQYIVSKSTDENFITVVGGHWQTPFPRYKVRRLSVQRSEEKQTVEQMKLSHVRSLTVSESFKPIRSCLPDFRILQVLDLECCKDLSSHQLRKICKMHQLNYLSLRRTDIDEIPPEIANLEYLEVLDIRETRVRKFPRLDGDLARMTHLLTGDKSKRTGLALTEEITNMTALQTLSGVEVYGIPAAKWQIGGHKASSWGSSVQVLEALEKLTNLQKLSIYLHGKFEDECDKFLLSSIEHLSSCSLKFLAIDDDFTGFLDKSLNSSEAPPEHLHTLELSGMLTRVPGWIVRLHSLHKLTLSLTSLTASTLLDLSKLPQLFSLTFSLDATKSKNPIAVKILHKNVLDSDGEMLVEAGGFENLQLLRFMAPVMLPLSFQKGAMPMLQKIELKFRTANGVYGLENLGRLEEVYISVSSKEIKAAEQIKQLANRIGNRLTVIDDEYNESSLEQ